MHKCAPICISDKLHSWTLTVHQDLRSCVKLSARTQHICVFRNDVHLIYFTEADRKQESPLLGIFREELLKTFSRRQGD